MKIKIISGYLIILILSFVIHAVKPSNHIYYSALPLLMLIFPILAGYKVKLNFSGKDLSIGLAASFFILLPYYLFFGGNPKSITVPAVIFQLLSVSFPEEFFFRGFLQDSIGRKYKGVLFVSLLFAVAHLPKAIFYNEWLVLLGFFPSLVMGYLYMKTNNIVPGAIFHLLANLVYSAN